MVSEVEEYTVIENYDLNRGVMDYFKENDISFQILGSKSAKGNFKTIFSALLLNEDALFLSIKFPDLVVKKISK